MTNVVHELSLIFLRDSGATEIRVQIKFTTHVLRTWQIFTRASISRALPSLRKMKGRGIRSFWNINHLLGCDLPPILSEDDDFSYSPVYNDQRLLLVKWYFLAPVNKLEN